MSFVVGCQCGKQFKVADEQQGKKAKCPGCGTTLRLVPSGAAAAAPPPPPPPPAEDSDPFAGFDLEAAAAMEREAVVDENQGVRVAPPQMSRAPAATGPQQKACPSCGSLISAFAMRCDHCGASLVPGGAVGYAPRRGGGGSGPNVGLGIASMICGILSIVTFCFWPISGLLALVAILMGLLARGGGMAKAGIITAIIGLLLLVGWIVFVAMNAEKLQKKLEEMQQQQQMQRGAP